MDRAVQGYVRGRNLTGKPANMRTFQQHIRCKLKATEVREMVAQLVQIGELEQGTGGALVLIASPEESSPP